MSADLNLFNQDDDESPFDAIRRIRPDGTEFWSARDLMPLLGYPTWQHFLPAIGRARSSAENQGQDIATLFTVDREKGGGRPREDFQLARFACYLVAMNGDPRKPAVAAAQAYFAIRTREAEVAPKPAALTGPELLAHAVIEAQAMIAAKDAVIAVLEPKAIVADKILDATGDYEVADAAKVISRAGAVTGRNRLFNDLNERGWIYRHQGDGKWRVRQTALNTGYMAELPQSHYHPKTGVLVLDPPQPRVTPKGIQRILKDYGVQR
ncbi:phage antirepressor KilAC domain-containing protein [Rhodococcus sp. BH5]|uniref:phage antirepressor KilAC domain-containing protein n=1 Tax=Rhodococcus sp. BH5 TaxID=2871702 RepID=UPI0022CDB738|nr:phage antirepressor KilAC domain-containing protein [Rhodococcus sp. BH5]MCZ9631350.1 phage antirepressor KilAC domain-containing protein [Rhodococcus sp. BH5]